MSSFTGVSDEKLRERIQRILDDIPHEGNREIVERYLNERGAQGIKASTLANDANALRCFLSHLGDVPLDELERDHVIAYLNNGTRTRAWRTEDKEGNVTVTKRMVDLGASTLNNRFVIIRAFLKWERGTIEYPPEVRGLKRRDTTRNEIPTDQLLNRDDLQAMLKAKNSPRERAILAVLYDSGLRASEFCSLNIRSVEMDEYGAVLILPKDAKGLKTGSRRVRLHESVPYLQGWLDSHPKRTDPNAALFLSMSRRNPEARMTPNALYQFTTKAAEQAGVTKKANPHAFRHAAATERARLGWTEGMMRAFFGWSRGSDMPSRYVHLAGLDYEKMELERRGLLDEAEHGKPALSPLTCPVCESENLPTAMFCQSCRQPISPEAEEMIQERRRDEMKEMVAEQVAERMKEQMAAEIERQMQGGG